MSQKRTIVSAGVAAVAALALVGANAGSADADPTPNGTFRTYAAVGSDTIQDVWNGLTNDGSTAGNPIRNVASYNAFGSTTIKTKAAGATFNRPAGSSNGVRALSAVYDPNYPSHDFQGTALVNKEVDFARSSGGPTAGTGLTYLPFVRDAVSVVIAPSADGTGPTTFTTAQLTAIYGGSDDNTAGSGVTYDATTGKPKFKGKILTPRLPQNGSGTRNFFQGAIGIPDSDLGSYVSATSTTPENDGTQLTAPGQLIPFSAAQWIGQNNGVTTNTTAGLKLGVIDGKKGTAGNGSNLKPGPLFGSKNADTNLYTVVPVAGIGTFNRDTYNVVPTTFLTGTTAQQTLVGKLTGRAAGQVGANGPKTIITKYGFGNLSYLGNPSNYLDGAFLH